MRTRILGQWLCAVLVSFSWSSSASASPARETPAVRAVQRVKSSVVSIHTEKTVPADRDGIHGPPKKINGMGTGIIVDERGYIVTNQHVIAEDAAPRISLQDGSTYLGRVISFDRTHDLAIIEIDPSRKLDVMPFGTSSDIMLCESVIAIGNAFGYNDTNTAGIVSCLSRDVEVNETQSYKNLIQTDAAINPGNSGGPLINLDGEVIGINVAIRAGAQRIGFAIPIDDARKVIARLLSSEKLNQTYHGLVTRDIKAPANMKLIVDSAEPNSPAAVAGFQRGDVIAQAGSVTVLDQADLARAFLERPAGELVDIVVNRNNEHVPLKVQLAQHPARQGVAVAGNSDTVETKCWRVFGLRLQKASVSETQKHGYPAGGMHVVDVRPGSPAAQHGIRRGDLLLGFNAWAIASHENMAWLLNHLETNPIETLSYQVIRQSQITQGQLWVGQSRL